MPEAGHYREVINTDAEVYGGSNVGNQGGVDTEDIPTHGYEHSVSLVLPPLACLILKLERGSRERPAPEGV